MHVAVSVITAHAWCLEAMSVRVSGIDTRPMHRFSLPPEPARSSGGRDFSFRARRTGQLLSVKEVRYE